MDTNATIKFEVGKTYAHGPSTMTIASRTGKTVTTAGGSKCGIVVIAGVEVIGKGSTRSHYTRADRMVDDAGNGAEGAVSDWIITEVEVV